MSQRERTTTPPQPASIDKVGGAYKPLSKEQVENLRELLLTLRSFQNPDAVADANRLCDMAVNALLYAEEIDRLRCASSATGAWIPCSDRMPDAETPVMILRHGEPRIGELRWEYPHEETFKAFTYWDDPFDDGQAWEHHEITHWMPLPATPDSGGDRG